MDGILEVQDMGLGVMTQMPREAPRTYVACSARLSLRRMFDANGAESSLLKD